ncbi:MAG: class I SAM-dependent methyltransferase [Desulfobacterales bacterium]
MKTKTNHRRISDRIVFFRQFLQHPLQLGSIIPSSRFLERRVVETADVRSARTIVELGPGNGGTTRAILAAMPDDARLLSIEVNPDLFDLVNRVEDNRLIAHHGSAVRLPEILSRYGLTAPDAMISGIPFSTIGWRAGERILEAASTVLAPGGRFVAYQVSGRVADVGRPFFGDGRMEVQLLNIPPMRIYRWEKSPSRG